MRQKFWKYQGTGNDFILFDGRNVADHLKGNKELIARLCDRRFGIGADGLIILEELDNADFRMVYYNSDGGESTMCGNGGRCSIAFAHHIGLAADQTLFQAIDGEHHGKIFENQWVELGMKEVSEINQVDKNTYVIDTGSPHYVRILEKDEQMDIVDYGREIRYSDTYKKEGINVNTIRILDQAIEVRTYERGVENETFSCGTGVTACALAYHESRGRTTDQQIQVLTKGGELTVSFTESEGRYSNVVLAGPAMLVYEGEIEI